jgi:hypothetical protein
MLTVIAMHVVMLIVIVMHFVMLILIAMHVVMLVVTMHIIVTQGDILSWVVLSFGQMPSW